MRWKCTCEYDGTGFNGWQSQPNGNTIQDHIENRLHWVFGQKIGIHGSGRTDAGVHAHGQIFHFDGEWHHGPDKLLRTFRCGLPSPIRVTKAEEVGHDFHARFSASGKCYKYYLLEHFPGAFNYRYNWCLGNGHLDFENMQSLTKPFHGKHDFSAFCANHGDGSIQNPIKTICEMNFEKLDRGIVFTVIADGFLYKMVRMLVGSFVTFGLGKISGEAVLDMLFTGTRKINIDAAPARGLFLHSVDYPSPAEPTLPIRLKSP
ncbi:MAG: tRNA pseudouridine(38-40) synthase TruA [Puniceicoccales bacterium]|jgi:tRNA pseudouridine38-40 synthase|nr:tRNA pseudouridine(38-40) synthase TruA [Puniceicoccales bacterium]